MGPCFMPWMLCTADIAHLPVHKDDASPETLPQSSVDLNVVDEDMGLDDDEDAGGDSESGVPGAENEELDDDWGSWE